METIYNTSISTGKTKVWNVKTIGNRVIVSHGFLDGKMIVHEEICEGKNIGKKNETTPESQAISVAKSAWEKKIKLGYSPLSQEKNNSYFPMLANEMNDKLLQFPCYVQPKLDGIRCIIYLKDEKICYQSRNHTLFQSFPQLEPDLMQLFSKEPSIILDGELYCHSLSFQQITSIVRKKEHQDLSKIQYHVYDLYMPEKAYEERLNIIRKLFIDLLTYLKGTMVISVSTYKVNDRDEIERKHSEFVKEGYEGLMVRMPYGMYRPQIRSKELLKYKHFKDNEFKVVGVHEGNGSTAVFECIHNDRIFGVNMKCSKEEKKQYLTDFQEYNGKMLTVRYQEMTDDGVPRFPVGIGFRIDLP